MLPRRSVLEEEVEDGVREQPEHQIIEPDDRQPASGQRVRATHALIFCSGDLLSPSQSGTILAGIAKNHEGAMIISVAESLGKAVTAPVLGAENTVDSSKGQQR